MSTNNGGTTVVGCSQHLPEPPAFSSWKSIPRDPSHWSQQGNTALVGDASLPWGAQIWESMHSPPPMPLGSTSHFAQVAAQTLPVCVKQQHQVKGFICSLKSQLCFFYTALNTSSSPLLHYFLHFTPREYILAIPPGSAFKHSEQLHSTALVRQRK